MSTDRKPWQERIGSLPHMIEPSLADAGYVTVNDKRDTYDLVEGGIALIDVTGMLVNRRDYWDGYGYSTYNRIRGEVAGAEVDPKVSGILLRVNSPGGETDLAFETADEIIAAGKQKPVWAVAETAAYSAGYLLASSADRIYVSSKSGGVGSIGVYCVHLDMSEMLKQYGVKPTFFEDPKGKSDGHPYKPLSDSAKADIEGRIRYLSGMFFDHVAMRRRMDVADIRKMHAKMFNPAEAIEAGLADRTGSLSIALDQFRGYLDAKKQFSFGVAAASATTSQQEVGVNTDPKTQADAGKKPADPPPAAAPAAAAKPATPPAAPDADPTAAAREAAFAEAEEITSLCAIAGVPVAKANEFIKARKSAKDVRAALQEMRASAAEKTEIVSQLQPGTAADPKAVKPGESPLLKAMQEVR
jgi:signal peptide peptidase SppA